MIPQLTADPSGDPQPFDPPRVFEVKPWIRVYIDRSNGGVVYGRPFSSTNQFLIWLGTIDSGIYVRLDRYILLTPDGHVKHLGDMGW